MPLEIGRQGVEALAPVRVEVEVEVEVAGRGEDLVMRGSIRELVRGVVVVVVGGDGVHVSCKNEVRRGEVARAGGLDLCLWT